MTGKKDTHLVPYRELAKVLRLDRLRGKRLPKFTLDRAECFNCKAGRVFPGPLIYDLKAEGMRLPLKSILHELPVGGKPESWSHNATLNQQASERAGVPTPMWISMCPACNASKAVIRELVEFQARILGKLPGEVPGQAPTCCRECGERRAGVKIDLLARFEHDLSMGCVTLIEIDPRGWDFRPGWQNKAEHWAFSGVLNLAAGDRSSDFRWTMTCPRCVKAQMPLVSTSPALPKLTQ